MKFFRYVLLGVLFLSAHSALASYTQLFPTINAGGYATDLDTITPGGTMFGYNLYKGDFGDTSNLICGAPENMSHSALSGVTLESCWLLGTPTPTDGSYWLQFTELGSAYSPDYSDYYYFKAIRSGGSWASAYTSADIITSVVPANGDTTATTTVALSFNYFLDSSSQPAGINGIKVQLERVDEIGADSYTFSSPVYDLLSSESHTFTLPTGSLWDMHFFFERDPATYFLSEIGCIAGSGCPAIRFSVVDTADTIAGDKVTCSITDIAGCLQSALMYLFKPSSGDFSQFSTLWDMVKNKPPFGYITGFNSALLGLADTGTPAFTLEQMPILMTDIFTPFRTGLMWVMWVIFAFVFINRVKDLHI